MKSANAIGKGILRILPVVLWMCADRKKKMSECWIISLSAHEVRFSDFMRIGVPFTLAPTFSTYVFLWVFGR